MVDFDEIEGIEFVEEDDEHEFVFDEMVEIDFIEEDDEMSLIVVIASFLEIEGIE